jgi:AcrR family transcriptional regulator
MVVAGEEHQRGEDARARAARTKRTRTRAAPIAAADAAFSARGWAATRVEDIAAEAGVSAATAYNHFPTKHVLIGVVFAPHVATLLVQADQQPEATAELLRMLLFRTMTLPARRRSARTHQCSNRVDRGRGESSSRLMPLLA